MRAFMAEASQTVWLLTMEEPPVRHPDLVVPAGVSKSLGRASDNDLHVDVASDFGVSRYHCTLTGYADRLGVEYPLKTIAAPRVDGVAVPAGGALDAREGSVIELGRVLFRVSLGSGAVEATASQPDATRFPGTGTGAGTFAPCGPQTQPYSIGTGTVPPSLVPRTRGPMRRPSAPSGQKEECSTVDLRPEQLGDILAQIAAEQDGKRRKKKQRAFFSIGLILLGGIFLMMRCKDPPKPWERIDHPFLSVVVPKDWRVRESGRLTVLSGEAPAEGVGKLAGCRIGHSDVRWWDFDMAAEKCLKILADDLPEADGLTASAALLRDFEKKLVTGQTSEDVGCIFAPVRGPMGIGRLFLSGEQAILIFVVCRSDPATREKAEGILKSWAEVLPQNGYVDRRRDVRATSGMDAQQARSLLAESQYFYTHRLVSPDNGWKAYQKALTVYRWVCRDDQRQVFSDMDRNDVWDTLQATAKHIDERFKTLRIDILRAYARGDRETGTRLVRELQVEIPSREDYRWLWAQKKMEQNRGAGKRRTGLF